MRIGSYSMAFDPYYTISVFIFSDSFINVVTCVSKINFTYYDVVCKDDIKVLKYFHIMSFFYEYGPGVV